MGEGRNTVKWFVFSIYKLICTICYKTPDLFSTIGLSKLVFKISPNCIMWWSMKEQWRCRKNLPQMEDRFLVPILKPSFKIEKKNLSLLNILNSNSNDILIRYFFVYFHSFFMYFYTFCENSNLSLIKLKIKSKSLHPPSSSPLQSDNILKSINLKDFSEFRKWLLNFTIF